MTLLSLKDENIIDIHENTVDFDVFENTFSPDKKIKFTDLEFVTESGLSFVLSARNFNNHSIPVGFDSLQGLIKFLLNKVSTGEHRKLTFASLLSELVENFCSTGVILSVYNQGGAPLAEGFIPVDTHLVENYLEVAGVPHPTEITNYLIDEGVTSANIVVVEDNSVKVKLLFAFLNNINQLIKN